MEEIQSEITKLFKSNRLIEYSKFPDHMQPFYKKLVKLQEQYGPISFELTNIILDNNFNHHDASLKAIKFIHDQNDSVSAFQLGRIMDKSSDVVLQKLATTMLASLGWFRPLENAFSNANLELRKIDLDKISSDATQRRAWQIRL